MLAKIARLWMLLLLAVGVALLVASLSLNVTVLCYGYIGNYWKAPNFGILLLGAATAPFNKEPVRWVKQIKACPRWMWISALALAVYGLVAALLQFAFHAGPDFSDQTLALSAFPLGFETIPICLLYSALWTGFVDRSTLPKRAAASLGLVVFTAIFLAAGRAGYLPHPARTTYPGKQ
jgi:hypothetical protein